MNVVIKDPVIVDVTWNDLNFGDYFTLEHNHWMYCKNIVCRKIGENSFILVSMNDKFENSSFPLSSFPNAKLWKLIPESMTFIRE